MSRSLRHLILVTALLGLVSTAYAESHLMRLADVHEDQVVFTYEGDLWIAFTTGGIARRLTNDPGTEAWAKFSPDGEWLAFTGQYDGGSDVYIMPAQGGIPQRLTFHPMSDRMLEWWPDGQSVVFRSRREYPSRGEEVYRVSIDGGMPEKLPVDRAGLATISPDGKKIAYNRISRESRTWKRHRGGTAQDIWMGSLGAMDYEKIVDSDWTENFPMWQGNAIYFNSDREDGTLNLYKYDVTTQDLTRLTHYTDYDVKYPSQGPGAIIFQYGETLHTLDLATGEIHELAIEIPSDMVRMRPEFVSISPSSGAFRLSPTGKRLLLEARGEIINLPVEEGEPIVLTDHTSGSREKNCAWSPDGRWIAFISDRTGEEEVWLVDQQSAEPWRQVTKNGLGFRKQLVWSPDSKYVMFSDKFMRLYLVDVAAETVTVVDECHYDDAWERWGIQNYVFSPDSKWVAYTMMTESMYESIFLYSIEQDENYRLTSDMTQDWSPSFDPDGQYLYFLSQRTFNPQMGLVDQNHIFLDMAKPYIVLLQDDLEHPYAPEVVHEEVTAEEEEDADEAEEDEALEPDAEDEAEEAVDEGAAESEGEEMSTDEASEEAAEDAEEEHEADDDADEDGFRIDVEGIQRRIVEARGVSAGNLFRLEAVDSGFLYLKKPKREFIKYQVVNDGTGGRLDLYHYKLDDAKTKKVLGGIANYHVSHDGKKLVYRAGSTYGVVKVGQKASVGDGKVDYSDVRIKLDRSAEFRQMFDEAWRIQRDWFYDEDLHGVDWQAMHDKYVQFVPFCGNRSDLNYLIGELIAELNIGHTYVWGGDIEIDAKRVGVGLLGAEFDTVGGSDYYRIARIIPNNPGDASERSPLDEPGCPIEKGHYLIAINGQEVRVGDNVYEYLQNFGGDVITLTYNDQPTAEDAQTYRLKTLYSEWGIRYREWVEDNKARVERLSDNKIGYVHLPDMGENGLREFAKYYYPQYMKHGLIIDARYNGGGFTGDMIIDRLERELWSFSQPREGRGWRNPERVHVGPWVVLINEDTGSNGEMFAEAIKIKKMAPVIGMRTWGGSIGIEPHQDLVDGGTVTPPQFGLYGLNGRWLIEGRGVEPDIEVQNMPGEVLRGKDPQLEFAIDFVLQKLAENPVELPPPPPYPDKSRPHGS